ncbi:MAG: FkbM family methyltransferase [Candidatus Paceibacterota bacterium]|jgi:FkbM family methyltransferase
MSPLNALISYLARIYRAFGSKSRWVSRIVDRLTHIPLPIGLSYQYGTLYGWTIYNKLHNPELETVEFFKKHLKPGDRIADVGANIGYYTLLFSNLVGERGKVTAFEPSPIAFARLTKATRGIKNIDLVNRGIYSHRETLKLYSLSKGDPMGSVVYERGPNYTEIDVIPLSEYPTDAFNWAKIDVEGAEIEVLRGMRTPMKAMLEVATGIQEEYGGGVNKFFSDIEGMGYRIFFIRDGGEIVLYTGSNLDMLKSNIYIEPRE